MCYNYHRSWFYMVNHPSMHVPFIPHVVWPISLGIGCTVLIINLERLLVWERLPSSSSGRYGYVEMTKCLIINCLLLCRSSMGVPVYSVYNRLFNLWSTVAYLRRSVHGWRLRRGILFPIMDGSIIFGWSLLPLRRSYICSFWYVFSLPFKVWNSCVHTSYADVRCNA
jgi:hypothetical protein